MKPKDRYVIPDPNHLLGNVGHPLPTPLQPDIVIKSNRHTSAPGDEEDFLAFTWAKMPEPEGEVP